MVSAWRSAPSTGVAVGAAIAATALGCTVVLLAADMATASPATRVVCSIGALIGAAILLIAAIGTWWCASLTYLLAPAALEIRYGSRLRRLRYDEIDEVVGPGETPPPAPTLWPGAHFGRMKRSSDGFELWRGTTRDPRDRVVVSAAGAGHVLTPIEPRSFRQELIENARSAAYVGSTDDGRGTTWLDTIAVVDGWVRSLLLAAGVVATLGIGWDVLRFGASQRDGLGAAAILLINAVVALTLSSRWALACRFVAAGALASQLAALF
jgi:hypothetical protein